jgi:hypothetical protein
MGHVSQFSKSSRAQSRDPAMSMPVNFAGCLDFARHDRGMRKMAPRIIQHEQ